MGNSKRRTVISGVITLAALTLVLALVFQGQGREVLQCLHAVPVPGLLALLLLNLGCPLLEAVAGWVALRPQMPDVTLWQVLTVSFLNISATWSRWEWAPSPCKVGISPSMALYLALASGR